MSFFAVYSDPHALPSFPTRRSSDLPAVARAPRASGIARRTRRRNVERLRGDFLRQPADQHLNRPACSWRAPSYLGFGAPVEEDRKSTRLNSSHLVISYAVFCLKKKI